jgi:hypothetical protein
MSDKSLPLSLVPPFYSFSYPLQRKYHAALAGSIRFNFKSQKWPSIDPDEIHELAYSALFHGRYRNKVRRKNINQKGTRPDNRPDFPPLCDTFSTLLGFFLKSVGHLIHSSYSTAKMSSTLQTSLLLPDLLELDNS